jgi:hypothetical protein
MFAKDVIKSARFILSDTDNQRWTDERLLALVNDGLIDIAKNTILFIDTMFVELVNDLTSYDLSDKAIKIVRVEYEDKELTLTTHKELDKKVPNWPQMEGTKLKAYVLDNQKEACFKLYPKLVNSKYSNVDFGGSFGIITDISYSELQINAATNLGDLGAIEADGFIKVYYVRKQPKVTQLTDVLYVSNVAEEPLAHYVAGRALRDNQDTQNRAIGNEELTLYKQQLDAYSIEKAKNFSYGSFTVAYNPIGA